MHEVEILIKDKHKDIVVDRFLVNEPFIHLSDLSSTLDLIGIKENQSVVIQLKEITCKT